MLAPSPIIYYFDMDAAMVAGETQLTYAEQAAAFAFQGVLNSKSTSTVHPQVMFNAGYANFDWPLSDPWWRVQLETAGPCFIAKHLYLSND